VRVLDAVEDQNQRSRVFGVGELVVESVLGPEESGALKVRVLVRALFPLL
tara:strand:+ start:245 stop:394 length:150 start_codon:yes stop_codon:yes gene_type:complete